MRFICLSSPFPGSLFLSLEFTAEDALMIPVPSVQIVKLFISVDFLLCEVPLQTVSHTALLDGSVSVANAKSHSSCSVVLGLGNSCPAKAIFIQVWLCAKVVKEWAHLLYSLPHLSVGYRGLQALGDGRAIIQGHSGRKSLWPKGNNCTKLFHA